MKELLENIYNEIQRTDDGRLMSFEQWYEQNQVNIDNAIELYLNLQGKSIVGTSKASVFDSEKSRDRLLEYVLYAANFIAFVRWYKAYVAAYKDIRVDQVNRWAMTIENAWRERDAA